MAAQGTLTIEPQWGEDPTYYISGSDCTGIFQPPSYADYIQYCLQDPDNGYVTVKTYAFPEPEGYIDETIDFMEYISWIPDEVDPDPDPDFDFTEVVNAVNDLKASVDNMSQWVQAFVLITVFLFVARYMYNLIRI